MLDYYLVVQFQSSFIEEVASAKITRICLIFVVGVAVSLHDVGQQKVVRFCFT